MTGAWEPLPPDLLPAVLSSFRGPWWLAGGWALDRHLGRQTRDHDDTDVLVLRQDHAALRDALADWDLHAADPPGQLRPWPVGEVLPADVHDIWCRRTTSAPWSFQVMLDDADEGVWRYRRDPRVSRPVAELDGPATTATMRVLAPEVQLLQKSKAPRAKDEADFAEILPTLDRTRRSWLVSALAVVSSDHPWLDVLSRAR